MHDTSSGGSGTFRDGFVAMLPLWAGAIPAGVAFGVAAQAAGLGKGEAQLMSLLIFSSAAQMSVTAHWATGQTPVLLILTTIALNAHLPLLGAAIGRACAPTWRQRLPLAWVLTDGSFAVAAARGRLALPVLAGAGASMYLAWNAGTAAGLVAAGEALPDSSRTGIDLVVPLTFVAVLVPLLRSRRALLVAAVAAITAVGAAQVSPGGLAVLAAGAVGAMVGAWRSGDG